ncbi:MAG: HAD family hydrolase [Micromonosporaceae bacterium]
MLFDLVGTLTTAVSAEQRNIGHHLVAAALDTPLDEYLSVLLNTYVERAKGSRGTMEETMRWVARHSGTDPSDLDLKRACTLRRTAERRHLRFRSDAARVLATLHSAGIRTGVVSDCTHEVPTLWPSLGLSRYVDAAVFSVEVGTCKPDPQIYLAACRQLGVRPAECVYVGDGGSRELTGARDIGMFAIRLVAPDSDLHVAHLPEPGWRGPVINSLSDLLPLGRLSKPPAERAEADSSAGKAEVCPHTGVVCGCADNAASGRIGPAQPASGALRDGLAALNDATATAWIPRPRTARDAGPVPAADAGAALGTG